jgi:hypothetical protein
VVPLAIEAVRTLAVCASAVDWDRLVKGQFITKVMRPLDTINIVEPFSLAPSALRGVRSNYISECVSCERFEGSSLHRRTLIA